MVWENTDIHLQFTAFPDLDIGTAQVCNIPRGRQEYAEDQNNTSDNSIVRLLTKRPGNARCQN